MSDLLSSLWNVDWFSTTAGWLVDASVHSTWLALIVLVVCLTIGRRLAPRFRHALWLLVAARLVMPVAPESPWSLHQLWRAAPDSSQTRLVQVQTAAIPGGIPAVQPIALPSPAAPIETNAWGTSLAWIIDAASWCAEILLRLWPLGMLTMATWIAISSYRLHRQLQRLATPAGGPMIDLLETCRSELHVSRVVELLIVPGLHSPAQMGFFRSRILLPDDVAREFSTEELRHILLHELAHVKRNDLVVNAFLALLRVVHWWSPVYWFTQRRLLIERELACDAQVVAAIGETNFSAYGRTLLRVVERFSGDQPIWRLPASVPGLILFLDRTAAIKGRLRALRTTRVGSGRLARCLAWTLCLSLALAGWTDAQTATPDEAPAASGAPTIKPSTLSPPAEEDPQTPLVTMTFDASETLDRIARLHGLTREQAREELLKLFENYNKFGIQPNPVANVQPRPTTPFDCVWLEATDQLVCRGSERILDGMTEFLRIWANRGMQHVVLEIQHIDSPVDLVKEILLPGGAVVVSTKEQGESATSMDPGATSNSDGHVTPTRVASQTTVERRVPVYVNSLTADWRSRLTNAAQADPRTNQLFAPKITVYQAVQAVASSITQRQFVVGFHANGTGELEPVINEVREGWGVQLSPLVIADTGRIRLEGEIQQSQIVDVAIATLPPGQDAKQRSVQVPTVEQRVYRISTEIAADETLLLHPLELTRDGRRTYFLISAEVPRQKP